MNEWMDKIPYDSHSNTYGEVHQTLAEIRRDGMKGGAVECSVLLLGDVGAAFGGIVRSIHQTSRQKQDIFTVTTFPTEDDIKVSQGGTIWVKHLENLNYDKQETLARVISNAGNVRFVASAYRSFEEGLAHGKTSPNLYRILSEKVVHIPKLQSRTGDEIVKLAHFIASKLCVEQGRAFSGFEPSVEEFFQKYNWPGNEGEMTAVIQRSIVLLKGSKKVGMPDVILLPESQQGPIELNPSMSLAHSPTALEQGYTDLKKHFSDVFEKEFLVATLKRHTGNVSQAARESKLDRSNFLRLLRRHAIKAESFRKGEPPVPAVAMVSDLKKAA